MKKIKISALLLAMGIVVAPKAFSADVLIYNGNYSDVASYLASRETVAGNTPTVISWSGGTLADLPSSLSGYQQVWDVNGSLALTTAQQTAYLNYLKGGGALFLMGENTGYGAARNATLVSFIAAAGGGTVTITSNLGAPETVSSALQTPNAVSTVSYSASGSYTSSGTGICLTKNASNTCSAIAFNVGTLSNATNGSLVSVLDINFLESSSASSFQAFVDNLIAYMAAQANNSARFEPISNGVTLGVAKTLDKLMAASTIDADMAVAIGKLSSMSSSGKKAALNRLTPTANNSLANLAPAVMDAGLATIRERLDGVRGAGAYAWGEPSVDNLQLAAAGSISGLLDTNNFRHGVWGKIFGSNTLQDAKDGYAGYKANTWGMILGADSRVAPGTIVGGAFTYAATNLDQKDFMTGSGNDMESYLLTGYASRDFGLWNLDSMLSYGRQRYKSHRDTTVTGIANATFNGDQWAAKVSASVPYKINETMVLAPFASLQYNRIHQDGYRESGAGALNLTVKDTTAERLQSGLGVSLSGKKNFGSTSVLPSIHAQWLHDFKDDGIDTTASFEGGGAAFSTLGQTINRNKLNLGGSLQFTMSKNAMLSIHYEYEGASGYRSQTGKIVGQWQF